MSLKPASSARFPRSTGPALVLLLGLGGAVGCSAYPTLRDEPINCSADSDYEFDSNTVSTDMRCDRDSTPDSGQSPPIPAPIEGGGRCGSNQALEISLVHNNDWGAHCPFTSFRTNYVTTDGGVSISLPRDESAWEGLSFWARAPGNVSKGFTVYLDDANTTVMDPNYTPGGHDKIYNAADGGLGGSTINAAVDPATGQVISGAAVASRQPDETGNNKGNSYYVVMLVTSEWVFYTIPWKQFTQQPYPNRVPNSILTETGDVPGTALLTNQLYGLTIGPPKEAPFDLWLDKVTFYRKKGHAPDAGPDALAAVPDAGLDAPAAGADAVPDALAAGADAEPDVAAGDADVDAEPDAAQM
jgi:hypothetical protein